MTKRLPAYARALLHKRKLGLAPVGDLVVVTDWKLARPGSWRIVVADDVDLAVLDFAVCAGLSCRLHAGSYARMCALGSAIARYAPSRLVGVCRDPPTIKVFVPSILPELAIQ